MMMIGYINLTIVDDDMWHGHGKSDGHVTCPSRQDFMPLC